MSSSELTGSEIQDQFDQLQKKLVPLWQMIGRTDPGAVFYYRIHSPVDQLKKGT